MYDYNDEDNVRLKYGSTDDEIENEGSYVTINAGAGDDSIYNSGTEVSIDAGEGNDTLEVYGENNTVSGGEGEDVFIYGGGYLTITDYEEDDVIQVEFEFEKISYSLDEDGISIIFDDSEANMIYLENSEVYEENGVLHGITLLNYEGEEVIISKLPAGLKFEEDTLYVYSEFAENEDFEGSIDLNNLSEVLRLEIYRVDASEYEGELSIIGNSEYNELIGGYGNNTLTGGEETDIFIINGDSTITDYSNEDAIQVNFDFETACSSAWDFSLNC